MSMKFCHECNNLLYPRENKITKVLEYGCRMCAFIDTNPHDSCVFTNELIKDSSTKLDVILSENNKDKTLQRRKTIKCPNTTTNCTGTEAVFFLAEQTVKSKALSLVFVCNKCGFKWMA